MIAVCLVVGMAVSVMACDKDESEPSEQASAETTKKKKKDGDEGGDTKPAALAAPDEIDPEAKLYADLPDSWTKRQMHVMLKGGKYVPESRGWSIGPADEKGQIGLKNEMLRVLMIPKSEEATFRKEKMDPSALKRIPAGDYIVYTSTMKPDDADVKKAIATLTAK